MRPLPRPRATSAAVALAATGLLLPLVLAAPVHAMPHPVQPGNRPTPIPGAVNGRVDPARIEAVEGSCGLARGAALSFRLLLAEARAAGVALVPEDCYRSLDGQVGARQGSCAQGRCPCAARPGTSNHGWGKAVDLATADGPLTSFAAPAYGWLRAHAGRYGWNHPGWARPGGGGCPEPWHWEWVGDGGTLGPPPRVGAMVATTTGRGYWSASSFGHVFFFGDGGYHGWADMTRLNHAVVGLAGTPSNRGYWLVASDGGVFNFGDAALHGSMGGSPLNRPVVAMARTASGRGYWLVASDGGVFNFGDAALHGSMGGSPLNRPVVAMAPTPSGRGYWLVASDGGVFNFGDAALHGSMGGSPLNRPVVAMAPTPSGRGYWLVAADGGVFNFGDARFLGSLGGQPLNQPVTAMAATPTGAGYWLVAADGGVFAFGDARFLGSSA